MTMPDVPRRLDLVLEAIKKLVPQDFPQRENLLAALNDTISSYKYTAPEAIGQRWRQASVILGEFLGDPKEDWKKEIVMVYANAKDYREILERV